MAIKAPLILSLQTGLPKTMGTEGNPDDAPWTSAIFKEPREGPVRLSRSGLEGDGVAARDGHGSDDQAVLGYSADHYPAWRTELNQPFLKHGAFGENFTISRLDEASVCIGDIFAVGEARIQVSIPRNPCWKLARRFRTPEIVDKVHAGARGGWYMRVLTEGFVERGNFVVLEERPCPDWTVARAYRAYHARATERAEALALAACDPLGESWRARLREGS